MSESGRLRQGPQATREAHHANVAYAQAEEIIQTDGGYVPVAWVVRYAAAKPWVKGIENNKSGEFVVEGNIYTAMLQHLYIIEEG